MNIILGCLFGAIGAFCGGYGILLAMSNAGAKYCDDGMPLDPAGTWLGLALIFILIYTFIEE